MRCSFNKHKEPECNSNCKKYDDSIIDVGELDTYIEYLFFQSLKFTRNGNQIAKQWLNDKAVAIAHISQTKLDFEHYSDHDKIHSENILEAIRLFMGESRLARLGTGDLWLLLESAYFHDIGMSLSFEELRDIWLNDEEFKDFFLKNLEQNDINDGETYKYVKQINTLISGEICKNKQTDKDPISLDKDWVIKLPKSLKIIMAEYVRKKHGRYAEDKIKKLTSDSEIEARLYIVVAKIAYLHTASFNDIFKILDKRITGMGATMHPQFVAALLRIGDLLDMDNNRFDLLLIRHFGTLPYISQLHFNKHKSLESIYITKYKIKAIARSNNIDVCKCTYQWFEALKKETKDFICNWSSLAPKKLGGCLLGVSDLKVYYGQSEYTDDSSSTYQLDKKFASQLLVGENFYNSNLDFVREYLQNAVDATKLQFWTRLDSGELKYLQNYDRLNKLNAAPFDFKTDAFLRYKISIKIDMINIEKEDNINNFVIRFTISDSGIGIEKEGIDSLTVIGTGWRKRQAYYRDFQKMLSWLRPTGGFGIGTQSAFMVTDEIIFETKAEHEQVAHRIRLKNPQKGGEIIIEKLNQKIRNGTEVIIDIPMYKIINPAFFYDNQKNDTIELQDELSKESILEYVYQTVHSFLKHMLHGCFVFPIEISAGGRVRKDDILYSPEIYKEYKDNKLNFYNFEKIEYAGHQFFINYDSDTLRITVIDQTDYTLVQLEIIDDIFIASDQKGKCECFFRGIRIKNEDANLTRLKAIVDINGEAAIDCLQLHRNSFKSTFPKDEYINSKIAMAFNVWVYYCLERRTFLDEFNPIIYFLILKYTPNRMICEVLNKVEHSLILPHSGLEKLNAVLLRREIPEEKQEINICEKLYEMVLKGESIAFMVDENDFDEIVHFEQKNLPTSTTEYILLKNPEVLKVMIEILEPRCNGYTLAEKSFILLDKPKPQDMPQGKYDKNRLFKELKEKRALTYVLLDDHSELRELYTQLLVTAIPFRTVESKEDYLIVPFDESINNHIESAINSMIPENEVIDFIKSQLSFAILIDWVWNYQKSQTKSNTKEDIVNAYIRLFTDYIEWNLDTEKGNYL